MKNITIFGSTGSIGRQTLAIVRKFPNLYRVRGLTAKSNIALLKEQIDEFKPDFVVVEAEKNGQLLKEDYPALEVFTGSEGLLQAAKIEVDTIIMALSGFAGLAPILQALSQGQKVALANKEPVVAAGPLLKQYVQAYHGLIFPVDSEHSAVFQALEAIGPKSNLDTVYLTASGGPFYRQEKRDLSQVSPEEAIKHPKWSMGAKLSVDSATLINKGLEVMEARWLFDLESDQIEVVIHPQSIVHAAVKARDGALIAHLGYPDMRMPIAYALSYPERLNLDLPKLSLSELSQLTFEEPDLKRFPGLALCLEVNRKSGLYPAALNAANEEAVAAFLDKRIIFTEIVPVIAEVLDKGDFQGKIQLENIYRADREAREISREIISRLI